MRISLASLFALTLVIALIAAMFVWVRASSYSSWSSGTSRHSAVDNPGYALLVSEIEAHLRTEGFVASDPPAYSWISGSKKVKWFRSQKYPAVYACTFADLRSFSADVTAKADGNYSRKRKLKAYTNRLIDDFQSIWDHDRHDLQKWPAKDEVPTTEPTHNDKPTLHEAPGDKAPAASSRLMNSGNS
ncbi:MAG: hypothetical protein Aurels2KO_31300 [Aureliella sp.]